MYKQHEHINLIGIDYDENCVKISQLLLDSANINDRIKSFTQTVLNLIMALGHEDLVFLSVDIEKEMKYIVELYKQVKLRYTSVNLKMNG